MRGRIELRIEPVRLDDVIDHAVNTVQPSIEVHKHTLTVHKAATSIWVRADRVRLGQVVINLLTNAAKYTPDGGQIQLECEVAKDEATLRVRDNGVGIDAEFLPNVFELFSQAERGLARSEGGLGIGLTLVRRLVELHGGRIDVSSDGEGSGSEFTMRMPICAAPEQEPIPATASELTLPQDCRVLVVDDSVGSAKIMRRLLQTTGAMTVELAHDGPSAIEVAQSFLPQVIFLDIGLPGLTGFEVAERLRADDRFQATRLIALTGYGREEDRRKSRAAGFDFHLVKPVSLHDLTRALGAPFAAGE